MRSFGSRRFAGVFSEAVIFHTDYPHSEFYTTTLVRTETLVYNYENHPEVLEMINGVLGEYHISADELLKDKRKTVKFLMKFHHGLDNDADNRTPLTSALTIAVGYFVGGAIPLRYAYISIPISICGGSWFKVWCSLLGANELRLS